MHNGRGDGAGPSGSSSADTGLSYTDAFPALAADKPSPVSLWGSKSQTRFAVQPSTATEILRISAEERRQTGGFGDDKSVCTEIQKETGAQITLSESKDRGLTLLISGKREDVKRAFNRAKQLLKTQGSVTVEIPKEYHRFILGAKGKTKEELETTTATKIFVPRMDEVNNNGIRITGPKEGIDEVRTRIMQIYDEQSKRGMERLPFEKHFHPFITGPNNVFVDNLRSQTGVQINIPPPSVQRDEISGEKKAVEYVKNELLRKYKEAQQTKVLTVEVPRGQHRYIQGPRSGYLHEILEKTGVWVELPGSENESDSVTLRGNPAHFGDALKMVFHKANSVVRVEVPAPSWIHKHMIGRGGEKVQQMNEQFPDVYIKYTDEDKITLEGPPQDVDAVRKRLEVEAKDLVNTMAVQEITVDEKYMKHIIGKSGANVGRLRDDLGVQIRSSDPNRPNVLVIEGPKNSVAEAVKSLKERIGKMENERSKDIIIDRHLHKLIIGQKGEKIREIRDMFKETNVAFPEAKENSDVVTIRGPKDEVEKCFKHLEKFVKELIASNHKIEVPMFKDTYPYIVGKGGITIRKIREETQTKIDLPSENSDSDVITITGKKENAEKAKEMIQKIQNEIANAIEIKINIPSKLHTQIIGAKGRTIRGIVQECGNVNITIPPPGSNQDEILIRGPKADAEKAKILLEKVAQDKELSSYSVDIPAKQEYHKYIVGANRGNVNRMRERYNVRIAVPSSVQEEKDIITVIGRKEDVEKARVEIDRIIKELQNTVDDAVDIPLKYHKNFRIRGGEVLRDIQEEAGNVSINFPRQDSEVEKVPLRGPRDAVDEAKRLMLKKVDEWESYITIEVDIPFEFYGRVMGPKGRNVNDIGYDFDVTIKFPERRPDERNGDQGGDYRREENNVENGENGVNGTAEEKHVIRVTGTPENCEGAKEALWSLVPVNEEISVPWELHRFLIGQKGENVRKYRDQLGVGITIPNQDQQSDIIKLTGTRMQVDEAKKALNEDVERAKRERERRELENYSVEMRVDPKYFFRLIGRQGAEINKLRDEFGVQIRFPRHDQSNNPIGDPDLITIQGLEEKANAARDKIQSIIDIENSKTTVEMDLDARIHARIIGGKGVNVRRLMDKWKVEIRFPRPGDPNPNLVFITGEEEHVYDAEAQLKELEDRYLEDVVERNEGLRAYHNPGRAQDSQNNNSTQAKPSGPGFVVVGAPWQQSAPQTGNMEEFPNLAGMGLGSNGNENGSASNGSSTSQSANSRWGPGASR